MNDPRDDRRLGHHLAIADRLANEHQATVTHERFTTLARIIGWSIYFEIN